MSVEEKYLAMLDRPINAVEGQKPMPRWLRAIVYPALVAFTKVCFRYEVKGRENLEAAIADGRGAVIMCNHSSYMEVITSWISCMPTTWPRYIGKEELFVKAGYKVGYLAALLGAFPVARDSADVSALKRAVRYLKNGETVQIYPEGTRRGKGKNVELRIHGGGVLMARMGKAAMVPASCRNADKVKQKGQRLRFPKLTMVYGRPLYVSDFDSFPKKDRVEAAAWYVMRECYALFYDIPADQVDMVSLFPLDRDFTQEFQGFVPPSRCQEASEE